MIGGEELREFQIFNFSYAKWCEIMIGHIGYQHNVLNYDTLREWW